MSAGGVLSSAYEERLEERRREGWPEGWLEGWLEGVRGSLLVVIEERFGSPSVIVTRLLDRATLEDLESWLRQCVTAPTLEAVFGEDSNPAPGPRKR